MYTEKQINDFVKYCKVQEEGKYNMIMEARDAAKEAGLSDDDYLFTIKHYSELMAAHITKSAIK